MFSNEIYKRNNRLLDSRNQPRIQVSRLSRSSRSSTSRCKHLTVDEAGACSRCGHHVPQYGSVFDTGTIKTYIKVVYVDDTKETPTPDTKKPD